MASLFALIGALVFGALLIRGALGFYQDYQQLKQKQDSDNE